HRRERSVDLEADRRTRPGFVHALAPYCYRCPLKLTYPSCDIACAQDVKEAIETATSGRVAGILAEVIIGSGGFIVPPKEYFQIVADSVRRAGGLFIADEVQTGWARTGRMFGIEHYRSEERRVGKEWECGGWGE